MKLSAIGVTFNQTTRQGKETVEMRYDIVSQNVPAEHFAEAVCGHWGLENQLHYQLDVTFGEHQSRLREGHAATNFNLVRRVVLSLLKNNQGKKLGMKNKRLTAARDDDYLMQVLVGA